MTNDRAATYALDDLVDEANRWLLRAGVSVADGRVTDALDARSVRYYQTLGVVERPVGYDGRRAMYGWRSLVQAVAVKLLQGEGRSLAQVQAAFGARPFEAFEAAVLQAVGGLAPAPAPTEPPALRAWSLAPGVVLTVDPKLVADPEGLARTLQLALTRGGPS